MIPVMYQLKDMAKTVKLGKVYSSPIHRVINGFVIQTLIIGIGTWIRYVDSFYINDANTVKLPSYTTIDLTLDYKLNKKTTFSFLLKNLTDEIYATTSKNDAGGVYLGEARSFEFGVNYKF